MSEQHDETIQLRIGTPKINLDPVDVAIRKLTEFDELLDRVAKNRNMRVQIAVDGGALEGAVANFKMLEGMLNAIGKNDWAKGLSSGTRTVGEIAKATRDELTRLQQQYADLQKSVRDNRQREGRNEMRAASGAGLEGADVKKMRAQTLELAAQEKAIISMSRTMAGLRSILGVATAMEGLAEAGADVAKADQAIRPAAVQANAALQQQAATAKAKTGTMKELAKANEQVTASDKAQAKAANEAADAQGKLLRQRTTRVPGRADALTQTFLTGSGRTRTITGEVITDELDTLRRGKQQFDALKADFARSRAELVKSGISKASPEFRQMLEREADAIDAALAGREGSRFNASGLAGTSEYDRQRARAAALRQQSGTTEQRVAMQAEAALETERVQLSREAKADRERMESEALRAQKEAAQRHAALVGEVGTRLTTGLRRELKEVQGRDAVMRASNLTDEQRIRTLRELANAYEQVARTTASMRATPPREGLAGTAANSAAKLRAEATALEQSLASKQARVRQMNATFAAELAAFGGTQMKTRESASGRGTSETIRGVREGKGVREVLEYTRQWDAAGKELEPTLKKTGTAAAELGRGLTAAGRGFLHNLASVTAWGAAVGTLYGTLHVLQAGLASAIKIERQTATLRAVYRGTDEEAVRLRNDVLALAAAEGRSADEAVDSAVRWARLGLTRQEANEAVRVSLVAANVAEISSADAAEQLSAIYAAYGLEVRDLATVLDQLNSVSNNLNVTNKDLLDGIARTGAVAKQAGLPLAELVGLIGAGVAGTGRTGAELGNALKSVIVSLSNPEIQNALQGRFGIDVKGPLGELKDMSALLSEIYVKSQRMNRTERGEFLQRVGGKQQASRLEAFLENYITAQVRAVRAQEDLGSAEREAQKIRETTISQWQSMITEMQRFVTLLTTMGGETSFLATLSDGLKAVAFAATLANHGLQGMANLPAAMQSANQRMMGGNATAGSLVSRSQQMVLDTFFPGNATVRQIAQLNAAMNTRNGLGPNGGETALERAIAQQDSLVGGMRQRRDLFKTFGASLKTAGFGDDFGRDLARVASVVPAERRGEFRDTLRAAADRRNVEAATAVLLREQQAAAAQLGALEKQDAADTLALIEVKEARLAKIQQRVDAAEKGGRDAAPADEAAIGRLQDQIDQLRGKQRRGLEDERFGEYDALAETTRAFGRRVGYQIDRAGLLGELPSVRGTEYDRQQTQIRMLEWQRRMALGTPTGSAQERVALERVLYGEGAEGGILRKLDEKREAARAGLPLAGFRDALSEGSRLSNRRFSAFDFGLSESERLRNQALGGAGLLGDALGRNRGALGRGESGAREAAEALQLGVNLNQTQLALEERRYKLARDIAQARVDENEEASKALILAGREGQLRAALLAGYAQGTGGRAFSNERFAYFDEATKRAVQDFTPGLLPSGARNDRQKLEAESGFLERSLGALREIIDTAIGQARGADIRAPQIAAGASPVPAPPQINIPSISFNVGAEVGPLVEGIHARFQAQYQADIGHLTSIVDRLVNAGGVNRAQSAGADQVLTGN